MSEITKAVIPAAGLGTRMKPISNYLSKPMLPLGKKPVLQHIIDELKGAGIEQIAIVTRSEYEAIFDYFGDESAVTFIEDNSRSGPGGAILKAEQFVGDDDFLVAFSDTPISGVNSSEYLRKLFNVKVTEKLKTVLSIYPISENEVSSRGVVAFDQQEISEGEIVQLTDILEKPSKDQDYRLWASACRYVLDADIFDALKAVGVDENGELQLTPAIRHIIQEGYPVGGYPLPEKLKRHDTGNFKGYFEAFQDFAAGG
jgi:UTP--glucose-1-phosphate uridylyltransferase